LITLDIDLPGASGFEICRHLKQNPRLQSTPVVFVSARSDEADRLCAIELGAVDFITKPFEAGDFIARLLAHLKPAIAHV